MRADAVPRTLLAEAALATDGLADVLALLLDSAARDGGDGGALQPTMSAPFRHEPYVYSPATADGSALVDALGCSSADPPPVLRIGDSCFTGDPSAGTGLANHVADIVMAYIGTTVVLSI